MMNAKLPFLFAVVLCACVLADAQYKSDLERANLRGQVKSVREISDISGPKSGKGDFVEYDQLGNEVRREIVSDFGEAMGTLIREVKPPGLTYKVESYSPEGVRTSQTNYVYVDGKLVNIQNFDVVPRLFRDLTAFSYDASGKLIKESYMIGQENLFQANTIYTNDAQGRPIEMAFFTINGQKMAATIGPCLGAHKVVMTYDGSGRPITKTAYEVDGSEKKRWTYSYDGNGNIREMNIKSPYSLTRINYKYEYDANGNWVTLTTQTEDDSLKTMLEATGKKVTESQLAEMKTAATRKAVTRREITYY